VFDAAPKRDCVVRQHFQIGRSEYRKPVTLGGISPRASDPVLTFRFMSAETSARNQCRSTIPHRTRMRKATGLALAKGGNAWPPSCRLAS
jgi:hypothetical protein